MPYIVCEKRKGNPRVNVEVCRRKCKFTEECSSYRRYLIKAATMVDESPIAEGRADVEESREAVGEHIQAA